MRARQAAYRVSGSPAPPRCSATNAIVFAARAMRHRIRARRRPVGGGVVAMSVRSIASVSSGRAELYLPGSARGATRRTGETGAAPPPPPTHTHTHAHTHTPPRARTRAPHTLRPSPRCLGPQAAPRPASRACQMAAVAPPPPPRAPPPQRVLQLLARARARAAAPRVPCAPPPPPRAAPRARARAASGAWAACRWAGPARRPSRARRAAARRPSTRRGCTSPRPTPRAPPTRGAGPRQL